VPAIIPVKSSVVAPLLQIIEVGEAAALAVTVKSIEPPFGNKQVGFVLLC
jgi:hypothetical protein